MRQRLISAAVLVPVVVIVFLLGYPWLQIGIAVLGAMAAYEAAQLVRAAGMSANSWLAVAAPPLTVLAFDQLINWGGIEQGWILIAPVLAVWVMISGTIALRERDPHVGFLGWAGTLLASLYPSLLAFAAGLTAFTVTTEVAPFEFQQSETGRLWLLVLVLTVWSLDSFAYLAGKYHGRGRFMNHISPNKTWSGVAGGTLAAVVTCAALMWALFGELPWWGALLGLVIAVAAQVGDISESMLKRAAGVKDSGRLIPGHGGILDRVDSFLFAAPALYVVIILAGGLHASGLVR